MSKLGVNIDHVATLRNARGENHPNILRFADIAIKSGADSITVHLREDRRHIKDLDLKRLCKKRIKINLEMACNNKMLAIALRNMPNYICIVPEKRKEITTEGGIDLKKNFNNLKRVISKLNKSKIRTSLFIDPSKKNIEISKKIGAKCVELHTGKISILIKKGAKFSNELKRIKVASKLASANGMEVHAGHGLDYKTTKILKKISYIKEFNIGHFIIGESLESGMSSIIKKFKKIVR
jgi:pyridoxine 5-phosphate synthase